MPCYAFILGTHPELSKAEIHSLLPQGKTVRENHEILILENDSFDAEKILDQLGGTIKIGRVESQKNESIKTENIKKLLSIAEEKKIVFGFSLYGVSNTKAWKIQGLELKKLLKEDGYKVRLVESREKNLSSVIVFQEKLIAQGADILCIKIGEEYFFGKTLAVQKFKDYSKRDYGRPARDMAVGMIPPKLAKMMINLSRAPFNAILLDPFCGSGTILQEALLLGYKHVLGSDRDPLAIKRTEQNLTSQKLHAESLVDYDARHITQKISHADIIVSEGDLGPSRFTPFSLGGLIPQMKTFYGEVFREFKKLGVKKVVFAFPAWRLGEKIKSLGIKEELESLGFHLEKKFFYGRPDAHVLREIMVFSL